VQGRSTFQAYVLEHERKWSSMEGRGEFCRNMSEFLCICDVPFSKSYWWLGVTLVLCFMCIREEHGFGLEMEENR